MQILVILHDSAVCGCSLAHNVPPLVGLGVPLSPLLQTEVLAAARAALGTPANATSSSSGGPAPTAAAAGDAPSSAPSSKQSPAAAPGQQRPQTPSSSSIGGSSSGVSPIAAAPGTPPASSTASGPSAGTSSSASGTSGNTAATEALTRRWSQLSDGQDLTRHVLQNALDQMQSSGAPIAAPKDASSSSAGSHSSKGGSSAAQFPPSRSVSDGPRPGGAGGVGAKPSRDIRSGASAVSSKGRADAGGVVADAGHTPAPTWAQSLLGEQTMTSVCAEQVLTATMQLSIALPCSEPSERNHANLGTLSASVGPWPLQSFAQHACLAGSAPGCCG